MKNSMIDLNDHLMSQMEDLCDPKLKGDKLDEKIKQAKAAALVADKIIGNAKNMIRGMEILSDNGVKLSPEDAVPGLIMKRPAIPAPEGGKEATDG